MDAKSQIQTVPVAIADLKSAEKNPRKWDDDAFKQLSESIKRFGLVDPIIANSAPNRRNIIIGGHFRFEVAKKLGIAQIPVIYLNIPDIKKERELNIRLNKNVGEWNWSILAEFDENLLSDIGFSSEELDDIFGDDENPEIFDLAKELAKLKIDEIVIQKGDVWQLDTHRMMCGDSTIEADIIKLMGDEKADMCFTDEPYLLNYLQGKKKHGKATEGFGYKRDRRYLETDSLPPNFIDLWTANINKVQKEDFSIIAFENWKNLTILWNTMERFWKIRNLLIWHLPNRTQGFAAKYKFFSKHDIAVIGTAGNIQANLENEEELLQNEYEAALYATSGKPNWEGYEKGKKTCPTDFVEFRASDEKNSGQGIIFGTKPVEILIPYIKFLTKRDDLIIEPFGGSGSTLIAAEKLKRRCYLMEKSPVYAEVIKNRWEKLTGKKAKKIS